MGMRWWFGVLWLACHGVRVAAAEVFADLNLRPETENAPFLHGVASADPLLREVLIWTRVSDPTVSQVDWAVWRADDLSQSFDSPSFASAAGVNASADFTVLVNVANLQPDTTYFYQFQAPGGRRSRIGRTKTASSSPESGVKFAFMSCTSLWSGYFNFYRHLARDESIDFVMHLGDYSYPDIDPDEVYRVPYGLCSSPKDDKEEWKWFGPANEQVGGSPQDNSDPFIRDFVLSLDCTNSSDLERYRWIHSLYLLDPDFREARAQHPFIVTLDNHDLNGYTSEFGGSRQAALEWIPQRTSVGTNSEGLPFVDTLRHFRFGGDLLDVVMLDTYAYSGGKDSKAEFGLLGDGQHDWLDLVLTNSSDGRWRVFGSAKTFMPFSINKVASSFAMVFFLVWLLIICLLAFCVCLQVRQFRKENASGKVKDGSDSAESNNQGILPYTDEQEPVAKVVEEESQSKRPAALPGSCQEKVLEALPESCQSKLAPCQARALAAGNALRDAHDNSSTCLRFCTWCGLTWVVLWLLVWVIATIIMNSSVNAGSDLYTLNADLDNWEGQPDTMMRLFDQLEASGTDNNNLFATGDMHYSYAADVFRFDAREKDTLLDYEADDEQRNLKRYGVEMLPGSGSRGNLDEKVGELSGLLLPGSALSDFVMGIATSVVNSMNPHFRYFDGVEHGYGLVTVTQAEMKAEFMQFPILEKTDAFKIGKTLFMRDKENRWSDRGD